MSATGEQERASYGYCCTPLNDDPIFLTIVSIHVLVGLARAITGIIAI